MMKIFRRVLSFAISLSLIIGTLTVTALKTEAATTLENHDTTHAGWSTYTGGTNLTAGNYILERDISIAALRTVSGNVTLCLNGHNITRGGSSAHRAFTVSNGATFTICDCADEKGSISGFDGGTASAVLVSRESEFKLHDITITANTVSAPVFIQGGTAAGDGGTFDMYSGSISDNTFSSDGGAVAFNGSTDAVHTGAVFNMRGGTISGNSVNNGGGVVVGSSTSNIINKCTFNMYGGTISGCTAATNGGGVLVKTGTFNMYGGTISGNTGMYGGNVRCNDTFNMLSENSSSPVVTGGISATGGSGANVYISSTGSFEMRAGSIGALGAGSTSTNLGVFGNGSTSSIVIRGGEVSCNLSAQGSAVICGGTFNKSIRTGASTGDITINDGVFKGAFYNPTPGLITVNGGWFASSVSSYSALTLGGGKYATGSCVDAPDDAATYTVDSSSTYTLTYELTDETPIGAEEATAHGSTVEVDNYSAAGYRFDGWYLDKTCETPAPFSAEENIELSHDTTVYAKRTAIFTVTVNIYDQNGSLSSTNDFVEVAGNSYTYTVPAAPSVAYHSFDGYATTAAGAVAYQPGNTIVNTTDATINLYPIYTEVFLATLGGANYHTVQDAAEALTADNQTITLTSSFPSATEISISDISHPFTLNLNGKTVSGTSDAQTRALYIHHADVTVINGTISSNDRTNNRGGIYVSNDNKTNPGGSSLTLGTGVTVSGTTTGSYGFMGTYGTSDIIVDGATLQNMTSDTQSSGVYIAVNGSMTIKAGSTIDTKIAYNSALIIEDGFFGDDFALAPYTSGSITTTGGWFYSEPSNAIYDTSTYEWVADTSTNPGYAGHIAERDNTVYLVRNNDNGGQYTSLDDAVAGLTAANQTLELLEDFSFSSDISISGATYPFTLDLGGYTLTGVTGNNTAAVTVTNSTVTITNGTINVSKNNVSRAAVNPAAGATVTLGSGLTISGSSTSTSNLGLAGTGAGTATLNINGAVISGTDGNGYSVVTANSGFINYITGTIGGVVRMNNGTTAISGGNFTGTFNVQGSASVTITGGNYVTEPSENLVALGYAWSTTDVPAGYNGKITYVGTYTVSFSVDGDVIAGMTTQVTQGKSMTAPGYTDKTYYTLDGWATTSEGEVAYIEGATITPVSDMTLFGKFTEMPLTASVTIGETLTSYHFFSEAFTAANYAGQTSTITLLADTTWSSAMTVGTDAAGGPIITLDLNGHTLTQSGNARLFDIRQQSTVTITDNTVSKNGRIYAAARQAINGLIINRGTLTVSGGTIETAASWVGGDVIYCTSSAGATVTVTEGSIITGGSLPAIYVNLGNLTVSGGFFESAGSADIGKHVTDGTVAITGGWFANVPAAEFISSGYGWRDDDTSNTGYSGVVLPIYHVNFYVDSVLDGDLSRDVIGEQSVTAPSYSKAYYTFHGWAESASSDPEDVVFEADDAISVNADKNLYAVLVEYDKLASLKIGSDEPTEYYYFSEAFEAAKAAGEACTIKLLGNDAVTSRINVPQNAGADITIDLNSYQLTNNVVNERMLFIYEGNTITITDNSVSGTGKIYSESDSDTYGVIYNRGILNISGGTIQADGNRSNANGIYMTTNAGAELNISGGTFITAGTNPVIDVYYGTATITGGTFITAGTTFAVKAEYNGTVVISDGFFKSAGTADVGKSNTGSMSITGGWFAKAPAAYFDNANYGWVTDGTHSELGFAGYVSALGLYVKNTTTNDTYKTIAAAVAALAADGQTIQLLAGFNGNVDVNISRASHTFTLDLNDNTINGLSAGTTTLSIDNSELTVINGTISGDGKTGNRSAVYAQNGAVITLGSGLTVSGTGTGVQGLVGAYSDDSANPATIIVDGASITGKAANNIGLRVTTNGVLNFISGTLVYDLSLYAGRTVISDGFFGGSILKESGAVLSITGGWYASEPSDTLYDTNAYEWEADTGTYPGYAGHIKTVENIIYVVENTDKDVQYSSLDAAILDLDSAGQTIVLLDDFDLDSDIVIASAPYAFTLDFAEKTFTGDSESNSPAIRVSVSTVTLTNGTIDVTKGAIRRAAVNVMRLGVVTLGTGLTVSGTCTEGYGLVGLEGDATSLTIAGATVSGTDANDRGVYIVNGKPFYMTSGSIDSDIFFGNSTANISGGIISGDLTSTNATSFDITGGYFSGSFAPNANATVSVTGGYFADNPTSFLGSGSGIETLEEEVNGCTYHVIHLEVDAASITLANQLAINYYCSIPLDSYSGQSVYMVGSCADEEFRVNGILSAQDESAKHFVFTFDGIDPRWMSEDIETQYYLGDTMMNKKTYSVVEYCGDIYAAIMSALESGGVFTEYDDELLTMLSDMLIYGKTAQLYKGFDTSRLCTAATVSYDGELRTVSYGESDLEWITSYASKGTAAETFTNRTVLYGKNSNLTGLVNPVSASDFDLVGATCMFGTGGYVVPRFLIDLDDAAFGVDDLPDYENETEDIYLESDNFNIDSATNTFKYVRLKVTRAGSTGSVETTKYYGISVKARNNGHYYVDLGLSGDTGFQFYPYQFDEQIIITLQLKTAAGKWRSVQVAEYSVNSYCLDKLSSTNELMADFVEAVLWYGKSSADLYTAMHS